MYAAKNLNNYLHADFLSLFKRFLQREKKKPFCIRNGAPEAQGKSENSCVSCAWVPE